MTEYGLARNQFAAVGGLEQHLCNLANLAAVNVGTSFRLDECTEREFILAVISELELAFRCRTEREVYDDESVYVRVYRYNFMAVFSEVVRCLTGVTPVVEGTDEPGLYSVSCTLPSSESWHVDLASFTGCAR